MRDTLAGRSNEISLLDHGAALDADLQTHTRKKRESVVVVVVVAVACKVSWSQLNNSDNSFIHSAFSTHSFRHRTFNQPNKT